MIKELKQSNTNNLIFSQVVPNFQDRTIPVVNEYYEVLNKYNKDFEPGFISLEAFLSAKLVVSALKDIKGALTKENFITAYKELPENTLKGIKIDFENKQLLNKIYLFTYENNRFKEINK